MSRNFLNISAQSSNLDEIIASNSYRAADANYAICGMLSKITYPTGGYSTFEYEAHDYSKAIKRLDSHGFIPQLVNETNTCGGLRIKSIKNYLNSSAVSDTKEFEYKSDNVSSGILLNYQRHRINYSANLQNGSFTESNISFWSTDFEDFSKTHIEYSKVTEKLPDGSRIEYSYTNSQTPGYMDTLIYYSMAEKTYINGQYVSWAMSNRGKTSNIVAPAVSKQAIRGRLVRKDIFKTLTDQTPLYSEINSYDNSYSASFTYIPAYFIRTFGYVPVFTGVQNIYSATQTQYFDGTEISKTNLYTYNSRGKLSSIETVDSKGNTDIIEYKYVTDTVKTGIFADMINNNLTGDVLSEKAYRINNGIKKLIGGKQYVYVQPDNSKPNMVRISKIYSYNPKISNWEIDIKNNLYDGLGNLIESEDLNGIKTSYIWGYGGLNMVAECRNASVEQIEKIYYCRNIRLQPLSDAADYISLINRITGSSVTLFEYQGNILKKVIDPSGKVINYSHDDNRYNVYDKNMKIITDGKGNAIKKYYYHTAN